MAASPVPNRVTSVLKRLVSAVSAAFRPTMQTTLSPVNDNRGWMTVFDWAPGAWQQDATPINTNQVLANWVVYSCLSLISGDVGKMRLRLVELGADGIWREVRSSAFSPVLKKPNHYQTRQKFVESWILSKLGPAGNAYILKVRDNRGIVIAMHVLDPWRVTPLVAPNGDVFYRLGEDCLATVTEEVMALPASEIIHDRATCLYHPLIGVSPIFACGLAAIQGQQIQQTSEQFFRNKSMPSGVITAPSEISDATAERIKREFNSRYSGENAGKTAVLGDGLKYEPFSENARDSQMTEQLTGSSKAICSAYHVPPFKLGIEPLPAGQKVSDMNQVYYADCLQTLIESIEVLLDEGLGLDMSGKSYGSEFDVDDLLRMDQASLIDTLGKGIGAAIFSPDEARMKVNLPKVSGGGTPYLQQQNYSLAALAKRDAQDDPFASKTPAAAPVEDDEEEVDQTEDMATEIEAQARHLPILMRAAA